MSCEIEEFGSDNDDILWFSGQLYDSRKQTSKQGYISCHIPKHLKPEPARMLILKKSEKNIAV